jgi:hypothetical protein
MCGKNEVGNKKNTKELIYSCGNLENAEVKIK